MEDELDRMSAFDREDPDGPTESDWIPIGDRRYKVFKIPSQLPGVVPYFGYGDFTQALIGTLLLRQGCPSLLHVGRAHLLAAEELVQRPMAPGAAGGLRHDGRGRPASQRVRTGAPQRSDSYWLGAAQSRRQIRIT